MDLRMAWLGALGLVFPSQLDSSSVVAIPQTLRPEPVEQPVAADQQAAVVDRVANFRQAFAEGVRNRRIESRWNGCYTTIDANGIERSYDPQTVRVMREYRPAAIIPTSIHTTAKPIVIIDPGHKHETRSGGYDPGAVNHRSGISEVQLIDGVASELKATLERSAQVIPVMTRETGRELTLSYGASKLPDHKSALQIRAEMAEDLVQAFPDAPKLFVSLHVDSGSRAGTRVYHYQASDRGDAAAERSREAASVIRDAVTLRPGTRTLVETADYAVTRCQSSPALLIEMGNIHNAADRTALLKEPRRIASQIAHGIEAYFGKTERTRTLQVASLQNDMSPR